MHVNVSPKYFLIFENCRYKKKTVLLIPVVVINTCGNNCIFSIKNSLMASPTSKMLNQASCLEVNTVHRGLHLRNYSQNLENLTLSRDVWKSKCIDWQVSYRCF